MPYQTQIYEAAKEVPLAEWLQITGGDPLMDIRFIEALEVGWCGKCRFWPLLIRDSSGDPMAAAILCLHLIDGADTGQAIVRRLGHAVRHVWPGFLKFRTLLCGIPVSGAQSSLRLSQDCDVLAAMDALQMAMRDLAWKHRARMLIVKEMSDDEADQLDVLQQFNFIKAASLPTNAVRCDAPRFEAWLQTLRSHYRYKLRRSLKKFDQAGLSCEHISGAEIVDVYTRDVHQMYLDVIATHEVNFEVLPYEFFPEFAMRLADRVRMTLLRDGEEVVAFAWSLLSDDCYQNLLVGFDYNRNEQFDLYFNLMIRDLAFGYDQGVSQVLLGQTSDVFKSRLGAVQQPRCFYVRTVKPALQVLKLLSRWVFPVVSVQPPLRDLYKEESLGKRDRVTSTCPKIP